MYDKIMRTEFRPIAMRCTQEQFDSIKDMIPLPIEQVLSFEMYDYLTNNYEKQRVVSNIKREKIANYDRVMHETFDGELFLDCCGRKYELVSGNTTETFLAKIPIITQEQKEAIMKEYLKDKVWKGSEIEIKHIKTGNTVSYSQDYECRLKPQPCVSAGLKCTKLC